MSETEFPEAHGTVESVLEALTKESTPNPALVQSFLLTYRAFSTTKQVVEWLRKRFSVEPPPNASPAEQETFKSTVQMAIRLRVLNFVRLWTSNYFYDFQDDPMSLDQIRDFLSYVSQAGLNQHAEPIGAIIARQLKDQSDSSSSGKSPLVGKEKRRIDIGALVHQLQSGGVSVMSTAIEPSDLAKEIAVADSQLFRAIKPKEFLNKAWTDEKKKYELATNIMRLIDYFNGLSCWVTVEVCGSADKKISTAAVKHFIRVLKRLLKYNDYLGAVAIVAGLTSSSAQRLNDGLADLGAASVKEWDQIRASLSASNGYKLLRTLQQQSQPPVIPYAGMYLQDLVFIEDGNSNLVNGLINFRKFSLVAKVITEVIYYQRQPHQLDSWPELKSFLIHLQPLSENELNEVILKGAKGVSLTLLSPAYLRSLTERSIPSTPSTSVVAATTSAAMLSHSTDTQQAVDASSISPQVQMLLADTTTRALLRQAFIDELRPELARMIAEAVDVAVQRYNTAPNSTNSPMPSALTTAGDSTVGSGGSPVVLPLTAANLVHVPAALFVPSNSVSVVSGGTAPNPFMSNATSRTPSVMGPSTPTAAARVAAGNNAATVPGTPPQQRRQQL